MSDVHCRIRIEDFLAYHDLRISTVARYLGWPRTRLERVIAGEDWISFEEREQLARAIGCQYPSLLEVKVRAVDELLPDS